MLTSRHELQSRLSRVPLTLLLLGVCLTGIKELTAGAAERPNILWISCEDISPHLGCYGDPVSRTPALDRLAEQGIRYTHAFTIAGVCAVNRSGTITGVYPVTIGTQHMRCQMAPPEHIRCFPEYLRRAGYFCSNNAKTDYNFSAPREAWDQNGRHAHWRNRPEGKPFFSVFNLGLTHEFAIYGGRRPQPDDPPPPERENVGRFELPPYYPDTPVVRADWQKYHDQIAKLDKAVAQILADLEADGLAEKTIVFFWSDHGVGLPRAKRWIYDSGTRVPLIVRIPKGFRTADQGRPGTVDDQLVSFLDLAPTVLNLAGVELPGHLEGRAFLGPKLTPPRQYVYAHRDRMDERYDVIRMVRDCRYRYVRNYEPWKAYYQYMNSAERGGTMQELRRWHAEEKLPAAAEQFMAGSKPLEELYDLEHDPHETHNLAESADHQDILRRMRAAHMTWVAEVGDLGLVPEPEIVARATKLGSGWAMLRQAGAEDLIERIRDTAAAAAEGNPASLRALTAALGDSDAVVRYWGAIGLGNLAAAAKPAAEKLQVALKDNSPVVRIAAARALCHQGAPESAVEVLAEELRAGTQWVRLHAAIVLDEIDEQARPVMQNMQAALEPRKELYAGGKYTVRVINRALNELKGTDNRVP